MVDIVAKIVKDDRIEIAKKFLKMGLSIIQIAEGTGLDVEIIEELKEEFESEDEDN